MLAGAAGMVAELRSYGLAGPESYRLLVGGHCTSIAGKSDLRGLEDTLVRARAPAVVLLSTSVQEAMRCLDFSDGDRKRLWDTLAAILYLVRHAALGPRCEVVRLHRPRVPGKHRVHFRSQ